MACYSPAPLQGASCFLVPFPGGCARKAALPPANFRGSSRAGFSLFYSCQADGYDFQASAKCPRQIRRWGRNQVCRSPVSGLLVDSGRNFRKRGLRACSKITSCFRIPSSGHLWPGLNREILEIGPAIPAFSLNRAKPNLTQIWARNSGIYF